MVSISGAAIFYELQTPAMGTGGSLWCDPYGPFEVAGWRAVGPFILRQRDAANRWGQRKLSCVHARSKPHPCKAFVRIDKDAKFLGRRHVHNHVPERDIPPPIGHIALPPAPSFEQIMATVTSEDQVMRAFRNRKLERFSTKMPRLDPESGEIREVDITKANALEISQMAEMLETSDGKKIWRCPVPGCARTMARRVPYMEKHVRHAHVQGVLAGAICPSRVREKLCPLCRQDQFSHQRLLSHIVGDHDTRLECTEHEFSSVSHYEEWKERAMREAKCFLRLASHKSKLPAGTFVCCKAGRTRRPEVAVNRSRLLGFECPASMIVELNDAGHVFVKFWRTHIGHTPHVLDVRCTPATHLFIRQCLDQNWNYGQVAAEACKDYFGGEIQRDQLLNYQDLRNAKKRLKLPTWLPNTEPKGLAGTMGRVQFRRLTLVKAIRAILEHGTNNETKAVTDAHELYNGTWIEVAGSRYRFTNPEGRTMAVVFPRRTGHICCEHRCTQCNVCVHRYGCTCEQFLSEMRMCRHVHAVAQRQGAPPDDLDLIQEGLPDNLGYDEALWVLARLNYEERLKEIVTLVDQLTYLIKGRHHVELDRLEDHIRSAIELLRSSELVRDSVEDEARAVLANVNEQFEREEQQRKSKEASEQQEPVTDSTAKMTLATDNVNKAAEANRAMAPSTGVGVAFGHLDEWTSSDSNHIQQGHIEASGQEAAGEIPSLQQQPPRYVSRRSVYTHPPRRGRGRRYVMAGGSRPSTGGAVRHVVYRRTPFISSPPSSAQAGPTVRAEVIDAKLNPEILDEIATAATSSAKLTATTCLGRTNPTGENVDSEAGPGLCSRQDGRELASVEVTERTEPPLSPFDAAVKTELMDEGEVNQDVHPTVEMKANVCSSEGDDTFSGSLRDTSLFYNSYRNDAIHKSRPVNDNANGPHAGDVEKKDSPPEMTGNISMVYGNEARTERTRREENVALTPSGEKGPDLGVARRTRSVTATRSRGNVAATERQSPVSNSTAISWSIATSKRTASAISGNTEAYTRRSTVKRGNSVQWNVASAMTGCRAASAALPGIRRAPESTPGVSGAGGFNLAPAAASASCSGKKKIYIPVASSARATSKTVVRPSTASVATTSPLSSTTKKIFIPASSVIGGSRPLKLHVPRSAIGNAATLRIKAPADSLAGLLGGGADAGATAKGRPKMVRKVIKIIRRPAGSEGGAGTQAAATAALGGISVILRREPPQAAFKQERPPASGRGQSVAVSRHDCLIDSSIDSAHASSAESGPTMKVHVVAGTAGAVLSERQPSKSDREGAGAESELNIGQVMRTMFEHDQ